MKWPYPIPTWLDKAFRYRGLKEIPGPRHNPTIIKWLTKLKAWWKDDETPWCGTYIAHCLDASGLPIPKHWYRAKGYLEYGEPCNLDSIPFGAICIKGRRGGGHVFFAVARSRDGQTIYGLGANQNNAVNIAPFRRGDLLGARYPRSTNNPRLALPIASSAAELNAVGKVTES